MKGESYYNGDLKQSKRRRYVLTIMPKTGETPEETDARVVEAIRSAAPTGATMKVYLPVEDELRTLI